MSRSGWSRREFLRTVGLSPALAPFVSNLPCLADTRGAAGPKQRLVIIFSPNGVIPDAFWPEPTENAAGETLGPLVLPASLEPLDPYKDRLVTLRGIDDQVGGAGDSHMRGMGCLLTGSELFPGNLQGGGQSPAGWSSGKSIDQELRAVLQADPATRTRFGTLELGVLVPNDANTWTRMVYSGPNQPIAPIDDPYAVFKKLYGDQRGKEQLASVLDSVTGDLARLRSAVPEPDRRLLDEHAELVRSMERQLRRELESEPVDHDVPELDPGVHEANDNMPRLSRMQTELLVDALRTDQTRIATLQHTRSVGGVRMRWIGVEEGHHELSHRPDADADATDKLTRINRWFAGEVAHLAKRLDETPEPGGDGTMLDHTLIVWTNELGKGNTHTLGDIPFVLVGGSSRETWGVRGGRSLRLNREPHNRLLLWLAHAYGHDLKAFGNPEFCDAGPLTGLG